MSGAAELGEIGMSCRARLGCRLGRAGACASSRAALWRRTRQVARRGSRAPWPSARSAGQFPRSLICLGPPLTALCPITAAFARPAARRCGPQVIKGRSGPPPSGLAVRVVCPGHSRSICPSRAPIVRLASDPVVDPQLTEVNAPPWSGQPGQVRAGQQLGQHTTWVSTRLPAHGRCASWWRNADT